MCSQLYTTLDKSWRATARIVLGGDVGPLKDYEGWLAEYPPRPGKRASFLSGSEVTLAVDSYSPTARFISADEAGSISTAPLSINEIKDLDSLAAALKERWAYCGNRVLGSSSSVESSDLVSDSTYVAKSSNIQQSSHIFSSFMARRGSRNAFGSGYFRRGEFTIRSFAGADITRCLEAHFNADSSDLYFSHNCFGCSELMFSFFQRGKRHLIGNLQLPKEKYLSIKKKLLAEIREELIGEKRLPSLFELAGAPPAKRVLELGLPGRQPEESMERIERAFASTFRAIFRKEPEGMAKYESWLSRHSVAISETDSPFGHKVSFPTHPELAVLSLMPAGRSVSLEESLHLGSLRLDEADLSSLGRLMEALPRIAYFTPEVREGRCANNIRSPLVYNASHTYKVYDATNSEYAGVASQVLDSKYIFGGNRVMESEFCINCHNTLNSARCFEADGVIRCSDSLFCHNSEGLQDCLFCFNLKGKRHAIGNASLETGRYAAIRNSLVDQLADEILAKKSCKLDIFTIGG